MPTFAPICVRLSPFRGLCTVLQEIILRSLGASIPSDLDMHTPAATATVSRPSAG